MTHPNPRIAEIKRLLSERRLTTGGIDELYDRVTYLLTLLREAEEALDKIATGFYATVKEDEEVALAALAKIRGTDTNSSYTKHGFLAGAEWQREQDEKIIKIVQLAVANNERLRPDIRRGHWIACAEIAKQIREQTSVLD